VLWRREPQRGELVRHPHPRGNELLEQRRRALLHRRCDDGPVDSDRVHVDWRHNSGHVHRQYGRHVVRRTGPHGDHPQLRRRAHRMRCTIQRRERGAGGDALCQVLRLHRFPRGERRRQPDDDGWNVADVDADVHIRADWRRPGVLWRREPQRGELVRHPHPRSIELHEQRRHALLLLWRCCDDGPLGNDRVHSSRRRGHRHANLRHAHCEYGRRVCRQCWPVGDHPRLQRRTHRVRPPRRGDGGATEYATEQPTDEYANE
jgi:hypothetical protein